MVILKRTNVYLDSNSLKVLKKIGEKKGQLKPAQMIRIAIQEFIERETSKDEIDEARKARKAMGK